ncbi:Tyrosine-protein kinase Wzc [hydrothermal vent metagenome]|uniref:non-specific protein-tyrosine kinase n=1 Tax=hydrothermal vent metagenome TaxID=652676 RepID=A0A1W1C2S0_9ZZZZ
MQTEEYNIDIKALFEVFYQKKLLLFLITLLFALLSTFYAYFQPNIYKATASVKVGLDKGAVAKDLLSVAMGKGAVTEGTEKDLINSRYLKEQAMQLVDFSHHYYTTQYYREIELYKDAPFKVVMSKGYGYSFTLTVMDEEHYQLTLENIKRTDGSVLNYRQIHRFGENVVTEDFQLKIIKQIPFHAQKYRFVIDKNSHISGSISAKQTSKHSTIFKISYEDTVPLRAQEFTNALAMAYVNQNVENTNREATQKLIFIKKQLAKVQKEIKESVSQLETFRHRSNIVNVENKMEVVTARVDAYESQLMEANMKEEMLNTFYKEVKKGDKLETLSLAGIGEKDSSLVATMQALQEAIVEKKLLREDYTALHPRVIKAERKISQLKSIILHTVENFKNSIEKRKKLLVDSIKEQRAVLATLPERERKYKELERKYKMNESMNTYLLKMKAEAEMVQASTVSKNRILDYALLPSSPIKPKRKMIVSIGTLIGFILGVVWIFLLEFLDDKIKTENEIKQIIDFPIVGSIPHMEGNEKMWDETIKIFDSPKSIFSESFRNLRSNLQMLYRTENEKNAKVILLTSNVGGEGKTTLSVNLAAIMSLTNKRTIVVNMDMRKPTLHTKFKLPNKKGLSELLLGLLEMKDAIQQTKYPYLDILSSGNAPVNPAEAILSPRMYEILEALKHEYEVIILDTPPIGLVADAKSLMQQVDINLYVVRANYSKKIYLTTLQDTVQFNQLSNVGIILNDIDFKKGHYAYYHNYGYYKE